MRKRWVQYVVPLGVALGILSSCEYNDVMRVGLDETTPKLVAPVLYDTLTVEEMATRRGESLSLHYDADQVAYLMHSDTMRLGSRQMMLQWNRTPSTGRRTLDVTLPAVSGSQHKMDFPFRLFVHARVKDVVLTSQSFDVVIKVNTAPDGLTQVSGTVKVADLPEVKDFVVRPGGEVRIPIGAIVHDKKFSLFHDVRDRLLLTLQNLVVEPASLAGTLQLEVGAEARGVHVKEAWGRSELGVAISQQSQVTVKADAFSTTILADQSLPGVELGVEVYKPAGLGMEFGVDGLRAYNSQNSAFPSEGILIENSQVPVEAGTLNVMKGQWNALESSATYQKFLLNAGNSNIEDPFSKGANRLSFGKIELREAVSASDEKLHIGARQLDLVKWVKVPMDGWVKSNLMRSSMVVDHGFFEATSNALQGVDSDGVKLEDIYLCFYTYNAMPLDLYARFVFYDKNNQEVMSFQFDESGNSQKEGLGMLSKGASVSGKFVDKASESYHELKITREQYDKLAESAVKVVTEYLFTSSGVDGGQRVALRKQDYVRVNVALRLSGKVSILRPASK